MTKTPNGLESLSKTLDKDLKASFDKLARSISRFPPLPQFPVPEIPRIQIPDISVELRAAAQRAYQELDRSMAGIREAMDRLPPRMRRALVVIAEHGWYLDPEMPIPALWELETALNSEDIEAAEQELMDYFDERSPTIHQELASKFPERAEIFHAAFGAHDREEYLLAIPVLLAQSDGLCSERLGIDPFMKRARVAAKLETLEPYLAALVSPLAAPIPISRPRSERGAGDTGLNRHAVLHGESTTYGTRENSLRAISFASYMGLLTGPRTHN